MAVLLVGATVYFFLPKQVDYAYTITRHGRIEDGLFLQRSSGVWFQIAGARSADDYLGKPFSLDTPTFLERRRDKEFIYLYERPQSGYQSDVEIAIPVSGYGTFKVRENGVAPWNSGELTKR